MVSGTAADAAGNTASASAGPLNVDETAPAITWAGNQGIYAADQTVSIGCTATYALSGVASTSGCAAVSRAAWMFASTANQYSATATDAAGNTSTATMSFAVTASSASMDVVLSQLLGSSSAYNGLVQVAQHIAQANNANERSAQIAAFDNKVQKLVPGTLAQWQADNLFALAAGL